MRFLSIEIDQFGFAVNLISTAGPHAHVGLGYDGIAHLGGKFSDGLDIWKKQTAMPEKLRRYIVDCCKKKEMPADMQQLMKENVFK